MSRTIICNTERLILRLPTLEDAESSFAIYSDPGTVKYIDSDNLPFTTIEEARESIKRGLAHYEKHGVCHFAVELKESGAMIGHCGFNIWDDGINLELVAHFNRDFWGNGYATEACKAVIDFARTNFAGKSIYAVTDSDNFDSEKLVKKIGFVHTDELDPPENFYKLDN